MGNMYDTKGEKLIKCTHNLVGEIVRMDIG